MYSIISRLPVILALGVSTATFAGEHPEDTCSYVIENTKPCISVIDRQNALSRPPIKAIVAKKNSVTLHVPRAPLEVIKFEEASVQSVEPDVLAGILQKILDPLKLVSFKDSSIKVLDTLKASRPSPPRNDAERQFADLLETRSAFANRISSVGASHAKIRDRLDEWRMSTETLTRELDRLGSVKPPEWTETTVRELSCALVAIEGVSADTRPGRADVTATGCGLTRDALADTVLPGGELSLARVQVDSLAREWLSQPGGGTSAGYREIDSDLETLAVDQNLLEAALAQAEEAKVQIRGFREPMKKLVEHSGSRTTSREFSGRVNATTTVKVTAVNPLTKATLVLPGATIQWQRSQPFELSVGLWLSTLYKKSYARVPDLNAPTTTVVRASESKPGVVPAVFVSYRVFQEDVQGHRVSIAPTLAVGTNNGSAEGAAGIMGSYGSVGVSLLVHVGRDTRLPDEIAIGQQNAPDFSGLLEKKWVSKFALGVSYRIPIP